MSNRVNLARIHELTAMIEDRLQYFDRPATAAAALKEFGSLYRRVGKNIVIVGKRGMSDEVISGKLARIAVRQPAMKKLAKWQGALTGKSTGHGMDTFRKQMAKETADTGWGIAGTVGKGRKGKRVYVNRAMRKEGAGLREIAHHEAFHNIPVVGQSEIAAHFVGGLRSKKGKLSPGAGVKSVAHAARSRPIRVAGEVAIAGGGVYGASKLMKRDENKR